MPLYTITRERCGFPSRRFVVRLNGQWIGQRATRAEAQTLITEWAARPNPFALPFYNQNDLSEPFTPHLEYELHLQSLVV